MNKKIDLDNIKQLESIDSKKIINAIMELPSQFSKALDLIQDFFLPPNFPIPRKILILGTGGGAAVAGRLIYTLLFNDLLCPVSIHQGYNIPAWVDKHTLAFVVSNSGETEEILNAFKQVITKRAKAIVITSGGQLAEMSDTFNIPTVIFPSNEMPSRSVIAYLFIPILMILERLGLVEGHYKRQIEEVIETLTLVRNECNIQELIPNNPAKQIASELYGKIPVIYGVRERTDIAALRWKNQICENSKILAHYNVFPDLNNDEIKGWEAPRGILNYLQPVFLRNIDDDERIINLQNKTKEIIEKKLVRKIIEVYAKGSSLMAKNFSLMYTGDWVSLYLAFLYTMDPGTV